MRNQTSLTRHTVQQAIHALASERAEDALAIIAELRVQLASIERASVETMRANGYSWSDIGQALGVTRAAAWQRFG